MKKFLLFAAAALSIAAFTSCKGEDLRIEPIAPPVVYAPNTLSGYITDYKGQPIQGATVAYGDKTTTTDAAGHYIFNDIEAGEYTVTASANNYFSNSTDLTVVKMDKSQYITWNAMLDRKVSQQVNVTVNEGGEGEVTSDAIQGNDNANIDINVDVDPGSVPNNVNLYLTPIYTDDTDVISRADDEDLLIGATLWSDTPNLTLSKPVNIHFNVDGTVTSNVTTKILQNGTWVEVPFTTDETGVNVQTQTLTSVGLFFPVTLTKTATTAGIQMNPSSFNNIFGNATLEAKESSFSFRSGADYNVHGANSLEALLIERLARIMGPLYKVNNATYPVNLTLPVGTAASLSALQRNTLYTLTSRTHSVKGTLYGTVEVTVVTTVATDHEGGSN
ncbi:MAG: carboxypeptidase regulatory-like domain-containing protein [Duncaniella sp.]|nr:carboxypeptidase regulatory-like domain-containing protein [Duncaniella sp.]